MSSIVDETVFYSETLQAREFRGLGDTRGAARWRVAQKTGVPESYLRRLRYEAGAMREVAGSVYRALRDAYEAACEFEERRADTARTLREAIERHEAADEKLGAPDLGGAAARSRPAAEREH